MMVISGPQSPGDDLINEARRILEQKKIMLNDRVEPFMGFFDLAKAGADAVATVSFQSHHEAQES